MVSNEEEPVHGTPYTQAELDAIREYYDNPDNASAVAAEDAAAEWTYIPGPDRVDEVIRDHERSTGRLVNVLVILAAIAVVVLIVVIAQVGQ